MKIVGLAGQSGTGKSTIAAHLTMRGGAHVETDLSGHEVLEKDDQARRLFFGGDAAMMLMGTWLVARCQSEAPDLIDQLDCFPFPAVEGGKGDPTVVVGGTSLAGGSGRILGTLIGAFIIAVIQNGMNLTGVGSYTQKVVLGLVLLGAVLLDRLKRRGTTLFGATP